jgi:acyl carrier protein
VDCQQEIQSFLVNTLKVAVSADRLHPEKSLIEEHGVDSAGIFEMILWMEDRFGLHVPPQDMELANFATIKAAAAYVERSRSRAAAAGEVS